MSMDKVVWLVLGNQRGSGKSVVTQSFVEWLEIRGVSQITVIDGDRCKPDVYRIFNKLYRAEKISLHEDLGWVLFSDFLCHQDKAGHIVANLPGGINDRAIQFFQKFSTRISCYGFQVKILFVMSNLPDGLHLLSTLSDAFPKVIPIKNLFFGAGSTFTHFDISYEKYLDTTILFPRMPPNIMQVVRASNMPFSEFMQQSNNSKSNFIFAKITVADWRENMFEAFDDFLIPN